MTRNNERDESIDTLLRSGLRHPASDDRPEECLDPEVLAAWTEGRLPPTDAARVETHLASCASCQEVLAVFARTEPSPVGPNSMWTVVVSAFRRIGWRPQWAIPIAAAATAAAIWVAVPKDRGVDKFERTVGEAISESAAPEPSAPAAAADAAPPTARQERAAASKAVSEATSERTSEEKPRRDAPSAPPAVQSTPRDARAKEQQLSDATGSVRPREANEQDQFRKAETEAPRKAAADAPAVAAAPAPAQESRARAEAESGLARQAPQAPQASVTEAVSPDPLVRWRILSPRRLERSRNGGKTWVPVPFPQPVDLTAVRAPTATSAIVTTADGRQFRTEDAGKTWNPVAP